MLYLTSIVLSGEGENKKKDDGNDSKKDQAKKDEPKKKGKLTCKIDIKEG